MFATININPTGFDIMPFQRKSRLNKQNFKDEILICSNGSINKGKNLFWVI